MTSVVALYEALTAAPDERSRARVIAEAFEGLEDRYPHPPDLATQAHVRETELRLQKEIEQIRAELKANIEQVRAELKADIEQVRADLRATELRLQKEIEQVRADLTLKIEQLRGDIARTKIDLLKWLVPLMFAQVAAIAALVKLL
ncbi:MAG: coiled-coil domain-containing protein [Thiocapsa sp. C3-sup]|uniref:coiled-coil domain-containing protein n=1 Tax=unclassified Thiocapsa TaxID=2641286 RepID=UPI0035B3099E